MNALEARYNLERAETALAQAAESLDRAAAALPPMLKGPAETASLDSQFSRRRVRAMLAHLRVRAPQDAQGSDLAPGRESSA